VVFKYHPVWVGVEVHPWLKVLGWAASASANIVGVALKLII
jgi:hypothetical protein